MVSEVSPNDLNPLYKEIAELIGIENTFKIYKHFRGQQMIFPQRIYSKEYIAKFVKENYDGSNIGEFSRKFEYSERRIRTFLKQVEGE